MQDRIEKSIELKAPIARVWRALTDHREFGEWFRVKLDGPFVVGEASTGRITYPGYEHLRWYSVTRCMNSERLFSYAWHPGVVEIDADYSKEPETLVEFTLESTAEGTRLVLVESGFSTLPEDRYADALRLNEGGWEAQMKHIQSHVES